MPPTASDWELLGCNFSAFGIGAMLHEDPRFLPSAQHGTWARTKYVLVHTLVARTDSGGQQPAFGVFAGALGFGFFPNLWLPPSENSVGQAFERSATFLGANLSMNMGIEFGPDDHRFFREKVLRKLFRHWSHSPCNLSVGHIVSVVPA